MSANPVLISSNRISGTSTSSITWNVPSTYKHLWIISASGDTYSGNYPNHSIRFNSDSTTNAYFSAQAAFDGGSRLVQQYNNNYGNLGNAAQGTNYTQVMQIMVFDYNSTSSHKNWMSQAGLGYQTSYPGVVQQYSGRWQNTAAVTSVNIFAQTAFTNGSLWQIYGLTGA